MSFFSTVHKFLLVRYCCLFATRSPLSLPLPSSSALSLANSSLPRIGGRQALSLFNTHHQSSSRSIVLFGGSCSSQFYTRRPSSSTTSRSLSLLSSTHHLVGAPIDNPSTNTFNYYNTYPIMSRRSSRSSSVAAAAKISGSATNDNDDDINDESLSKSSEAAVLKGAEKTKANDTTIKKSPKKKTKASPKKKSASTKKKGKAKTVTNNSSSSDNEEEEDSKPKATKKKASPKKRKSKSSTTTSASGDDDESSTTKNKKAKAASPKKKKAKAADHQRWTERTPLTKLWSSQTALQSTGSYTFTIISWNVAGLRALIKKRPDALTELAQRYNADVICLQETKLQEMHMDDPKLKLREYFSDKLEGYDGHWSYSVEKKGYSGTAMFIRNRAGGKTNEGGGGEDEKKEKGKKKQATLGAFFKQSGGKSEEGTKSTSNDGGTGDIDITHLIPTKVDTDLGLPAHDGEGRTITAEFPLFYLTNVYVPNSGQKLDRLTYRTEQWDTDFLSKMQQLEKEGNKPVIWLGDLNVAHNEKDTWNEGAKHLVKSAGTTPQERASFDQQLSAGYVDAFRHLHPDGRGHYSYWSQRAGNREPNKGLRLDYFICSRELLEDGKKVCVRDSFMVPDEVGSDHCPIVLEIEIKK